MLSFNFIKKIFSIIVLASTAVTIIGMENIEKPRRIIPIFIKNNTNWNILTEYKLRKDDQISNLVIVKHQTRLLSADVFNLEPQITIKTYGELSAIYAHDYSINLNAFMADLARRKFPVNTEAILINVDSNVSSYDINIVGTSLKSMISEIVPQTMKTIRISSKEDKIIFDILPGLTHRGGILRIFESIQMKATALDQSLYQNYAYGLKDKPTELDKKNAKESLRQEIELIDTYYRDEQREPDLATRVIVKANARWLLDSDLFKN